MVQDLDRPLSAQCVGQVGRAGLGCGQVGDRLDGDGRPAAGTEVQPAAPDPHGVREVQGERAGAGDHLQAADVVASVSAGAGLVRNRDFRPGQGLELPIQTRLILLYREDVGGFLVAGQPAGVFALGV